LPNYEGVSIALASFYEGKDAGVEAGLMGRGSSANATTVAPESCRVLMRLLLAFEQPARRAAMSMSGNSRIICLSLLIVDGSQHCAGLFSCYGSQSSKRVAVVVVPG
jgi:hypothetical protein